MRRVARWILPVLWLCGLGFSIYLYGVFIDALDGDVAEGGLCAVGGFFDCEAAAMSRWSRFLGFPLAAWGAGFYLGSIVLWGFELQGNVVARNCLAIVSGAAVFVSLLLAVVSVVELNHLCPYCGIIYVINILAFGLLVLGGYLQNRAGDWGLLSAPATAFVIVMALTLGAFEWHLAQQRVLPKGPMQTLANHEDVPMLGNPEAPVVITVFSDFECGHCARAHRLLSVVQKAYGDQVALSYRHFPLNSACNEERMKGKTLHPNACYAAKLAIAAAAQNKFWEVSHGFFEALGKHTKDRSKELYEKVAAEQGLDLDLFHSQMATGRLDEVLRRDVDLGNKLRINATPTLFVNEHKVMGIPADLGGLIERELRDIKQESTLQ